MRHASDYQVIISDQGIPVFTLPYSDAAVEGSVMLYDGGNHATLYRNQNDVILLDYLPAELKPVLNKCSWAAVLETNNDGSEIMRDYKVAIKKVKINPHIDNMP